MRHSVHLSLAALVSCAMSLAAAKAAPAGPLTFKGANLGMTQAAWRVMTPPAPLPPHTQAMCSDDPGGGGLKRTVAEQTAGEVVCAYVSRYGRIILPQSFPFEGTYRMTRLRYVFNHDRLTSIQLHASIDAYDPLVARLKGLYGPADTVARDTVRTELGRTPRVTQTWNTPSGAVELMDPVPPYTELSLRFTAGNRGSATKVAAATANRPSS